MDIYLEPEQLTLFERLVEAFRNTPRESRHAFLYMKTLGGSVVQGNGFNERVIDMDMSALFDVGLLRLDGRDSFRIPPPAMEFYRQLKAEGKPEQMVQDTILEYSGSDVFRTRYGAAYSRWKEAADLLWGADSEQELSTIGHKCREAIQEFATALIDRFEIAAANPEKQKTRDRFSAVIAHRREDLGDAKTELLDALFGYWRAAGDLIQRQEHAGQKEGEPLTWEDGRRSVFQTAVLMFEADKTL